MSPPFGEETSCTCTNLATRPEIRYTVLRRYSDGIKADLANGNITISDFVVLPTGNVIVNGQTNSTGAQWVRRITSTGGLRTLSDNNSSWLREFPDGNVYMGLFGSSNYGVWRYVTADDGLDPRLWVGSASLSPYFAVSASLCAPVFCQGIGRDVKQIFETREGEEFAISSDGIHGNLMKYFPILSRPTTQVANVSLAESVPGNLVLAGRNSASQNVMTLYNTDTDTEIQLIGPSNEIEIYHVDFVASTNRIMCSSSTARMFLKAI